MLTYKIKLSADDNGTVLVTCPALPELATFGDTEAEARQRATAAIEVALAARLHANQDLPLPIEMAPGPRAPDLPTLTALKVLLWHALRRAGLTRAELARRMGVHREQVDRLFRIEHASQLGQLDAAFRAAGATVTIKAEFPDAA